MSENRRVMVSFEFEIPSNYKIELSEKDELRINNHTVFFTPPDISFDANDYNKETMKIGRDLNDPIQNSYPFFEWD